MKRLILLLLLATSARAQLSPASSSTGSISTNASTCANTLACVVLHMASSNVGYSVTISGTWTGTLTVEQSGDNQGSWTSATTTTGNTLYTSALTPGITDVRVRGSAAMTGAAVVTITASGPAVLQQITQTGAGGVSALPTGTDSGSVVNAYIVNPTPALSSLSNFPAITFTTTRSNTGASTINVSGLGVKPIILWTGAALNGINAAGGGPEITSGILYQIIYDGTSWNLMGWEDNTTGGWHFNSSPSGLPFVAGATGGVAGLTLFSAPLGVTGLNRQMMNFVCVASPGGCNSGSNNAASFGFDGDNEFLIGTQTGGVVLEPGTQPAFVFGPIGQPGGLDISARVGAGGYGNDLIIDPGVAKSFGDAICIGNGNANCTTGQIFEVDSVGGYVTDGNKKFVTADFTDSTTGTLTAIPGLSWVFPNLKARNFSFHCGLLFNQATAAVSDSFGIGSTVAPTNISAGGVSFSGVSGAPTAGTLVGLTTTTPTAIVTFTPSAITTVWMATLDGTIEMASANPEGTITIYVSTSVGADNLIVKRGSYCSLY